MDLYPFDPAIATGLPIPPSEHAISVSLPTWQSNLDLEEDKKRAVTLLVRGYPRFVVHQNIRKLGKICVEKFGGDPTSESGMIFPTEKIAHECRAFVERRTALNGSQVATRLAHLRLLSSNNAFLDLFAVIFPVNAFVVAKQFWQHTGLGITTRYAALCFEMLATATGPLQAMTNGDSDLKITDNACENVPVSGDMLPRKQICCQFDLNIDNAAGATAKRVVTQRIAALYNQSDAVHSGISESDVFLFPTGMAGIWETHQLVMSTISHTKSICFGFLYTDTLKVLQKWGPGCYHLGHGITPSIDELETLLENISSSRTNDSPPVAALFTEFPSNPLLQSFDLVELRRLADKHNFPIVVDDTIATAVNADILPYVDIIVTSLSKFFSGYADVMGGR
ncbi:hypothetical protein ONZ45_g3934 [Pleurotus djamor]|nr:hypothetical protein ONZ45_g3934 [Pleurotus djamor]